MSEYRGDEFHLYFIVRSMVMGLLGAGTFSVVISLLHTSKLLYVLSISVASFFIVLFITRTFDGQIRQLVEMILAACYAVASGASILDTQRILVL